MTGITIPDSVTSIGANAFEFCNDLTIIGYAGSYAEAYAKENEIEFKVIEAEQKSAAAGDINGDGKVNLKDVVILRRYIAGGWNVTLN